MWRTFIQTVAIPAMECNPGTHYPGLEAVKLKPVNLGLKNNPSPGIRATGNSRFENAKFPPAKEKIPENSRSVKCLILHALTQ